MAVEAGSAVRSPVEKFLSAGEIAGVLERTGAAEGDLVCIVADRADRADVALDGLRRDLAARLDLVPPNTWSFCWMVDPPLFEYSDEEQRWVSMHHPFTSPASDDLAPETARARAYDLVLNGFEIGGGSIRIHDPAVQRRVFEALQLPPDEVEEQFGHLLRALSLGAPPHGGIAMGLDRLVMVLAGKDAIRDVIAFPKSQSGTDPLTGAPAPVDAAQLRELGIVLVHDAAEPEGGLSDGRRAARGAHAAADVRGVRRAGPPGGRGQGAHAHPESGGSLPSIVLWGPAGTGKTTLAHLLADAVGAELVQLSAVNSGVADARKVMEGARGGSVPHGAVRRRGPPVVQGPAGRAAARGRGGHDHADRRHDREPVLLLEHPAAVAMPAAAARAARRGRRAHPRCGAPSRTTSAAWGARG